MAAPEKKGVDYVPIDVNIAFDDKMLLIEAEFGIKGFAVMFKLLLKIYSEGYYYKWTKKEQLLFAKVSGVTGGLVDEVVKKSIEWGWFDKTLFNKFQILTSKGIQQRYFEIVKRRKSVKINPNFILIDVNEYINLVNVNINSVNVDINSQSKVKYSKVKKENNSVGDSSEPPPNKFAKFSTETKNLYKRIYPLFEKRHQADTDAKHAQHLNILRLAQKDFTIKEIESAVVFARQDEFWIGNFKTIKALRSKNGEGVMKIENILTSMKSNSSSKTSKSSIKPTLNLKRGENV